MGKELVISTENIRYGAKHCNECGTPMIISKRKADYSTRTGELNGHYLDITCPRNRGGFRFKCSGINWGYQDMPKEKDTTVT